MRITVSGRNLATSATAQVRGSRMLIPVVPVAIELGYAINVDTTAETVQVRRSGIDASFTKQTAEIRENGTVAAVLAGMADISFPANKSDLLLPIEAVAPLLAVSITIDREQGIIRIEPETASAPTSSDAPRDRVEISRADYNYGVNIIGGQMSQNLNLSSSGRIGESRYFTSGSLTGGAGGPSFFLRSGNFTLIRPNDQRFQAGDFSTGSDLLLTSAGMRGLSYDQSLNDQMKMGFYGGKAISGATLGNGSVAVPQYDVAMFGGKFTYSPNKAVPGTISERSLIWTTGSDLFSGVGQSGQEFDTSLRYKTSVNQLDAEAALGHFLGATNEHQTVNGLGSGVTIDDTFTPWQQLTLQGRFSRYSPNFVTPQRTGQYNDQQTFSFGASYRVNQRLFFTGSASDGGSVSDPEKKTRLYSFSSSFDPAQRFFPRMMITYTNLDSPAGKLQSAQVNLSREFHKWRPFAYYAMARGTGIKANSITVGTSYITDHWGSFQAVQSVGTGKTGSFDWYPSRPVWGRIQLATGVGYTDVNHNFTPLGHMMASVRLPLGQSLQFSYARTTTYNEFRWTMSGPLMFWRKAETSVAGNSANGLSDSTLLGRVYIDSNLNNRFDAQTDLASAGITVMLDSTQTTVTDAQGNYRFSHVPPGAHTVSISLYDVRADVIPSNSASHTVLLSPRRIVTSDFRLVKSGRIQGRIWQDLNGNGKYDEGEPGIGNVRIVITGGHDTYSDSDGTFIMGDLPAGEQTIFLDQRTLPSELIIAATQQQVDVKAGQSTDGVTFIFRQKIRPTEEKVFKNGKMSHSSQQQ